MKEKREDRESAYVMDRCGEAKRLLHSLPYRLTGAQLRALKEVYGDLAGRKIMNRLIQGDVGSGKPSSPCWRSCAPRRTVSREL